MSTTVTFDQKGTFQAKYAADDWLRLRGFSVGPSSVDGPCAIWHGDCVISKWRNLSAQEKREVHAIMEGELREGPVTIRLMPGATDEARAAFALTDAEAQAATTIQALPVDRDSNGWWTHPGIPDFDEGQEKEYRAWLASQGLEVKHAMLEWEPEHPLYDAWFDDGECDCSSWTPEKPEGDGWFTLSIHDTEDGPVWVWARPTPQGE